MPNYVMNKIIFAAEHAENIMAICSPEGQFDFETLIPTPLSVYRGGLSKDDNIDFPQKWHSWNVENWGTKWNSCDTWIEVHGEVAHIKFLTAWSCPYPIIVAFANKFNISFEYKYLDECNNFWGIEKWGSHVDSPEVIQRLEKKYSHDEDLVPLCIELAGYDPREEEDDSV